MLRSSGLPRAALQRARADWAVLLGACLLLVASVTLVTATTQYGEAVAGAGLQRAVTDATPGDRTVVVRSNAFPADVARIDAVIRPEVAGAIEASGGEVALVLRSDPFVPASAGSDPAHDPGGAETVLAAFEGIDRHATLIVGRWPAAGSTTLEATLSEPAAATMGIAAGDTIALVNRLAPEVVLDVVIVGTWRPDRADPYWLGSTLELDGVGRSSDYAARGPLVVAAADLERPGLTRSVALEWRAIPSAAGLTVDDIGPLRAATQELSNRLGPMVDPGRSVSAASGLPDLLGAVDRSILVSRAGIALLTVQFAVLAAYAVLLVAGMLVERRRPEVALLRSRGATNGHLVALAVGEAVLITLPAVLLASPLAAAIVSAAAPVPAASAGVAGAGAGITTGFLPAAVAGLAAIVVLSLPTLAAGLNPARVRAVLARPLGQTLGQRLGVDLVLAVLAAIALWQLRLYGAPITRDVQGAFGLDPLLIAAPAIGLLAGAVLAVRVVPRIAEVTERLLARRLDLLPPLGARQVARRPLRYTPTALLLLLAAALGTFAAAYQATWTRSQVDQAAYRAAGDIRVVAGTGGALRSWQVAPALRALPGVREAVAVGRSTASAGTALRQADLVAVDPATAAVALADTPAIDGGPRPPEVLAALAGARAAVPGVDLPAGTRRIGVDLEAALVALQGDTERDGQVAVAVVVAARDGLARIEAAAVPFGSTQRAVVSLAAGDTGAALDGPLRLIGIELTLTATPESSILGGFTIGGVHTSTADDGDAWIPTAFDPADPAWTWERFTPPRFRPLNPEDPATVDVGPAVDGVPTDLGPIVATPSEQPVAVRIAVGAAMAGAVPAAANRAFLDGAGTVVGERIHIAVGGERVEIALLALAPSFPPLEPDRPFLVLDTLALQLARYATSGQVTAPREWWLAVDEGAEADVARAAAAPPFGASAVLSRPVLAASLATDVIPLGVIGALAFGALAAAIVAAIGFVMSATASVTERLGEFALLRALGVSGRAIARWLVVEQAALLTFGLVAGTALGVLLAWLVLPFASLTATGATPVPPPVVVIPWAAIAPVWLAAAALLGVAAALLVRRIPSLSLSSLLRSRDG